MTRPCPVDRCNVHIADDRQVCRACAGTTRADLHAIDTLYALLPEVMETAALGSNAPRRNTGHSSDTPMPGGRHLVLMAAGSDTTGPDNHPDDPCSIPWELGRWENDWRHTRNEPAAPYPVAVSTSVHYLARTLNWAAKQHPAFPDFHHDMRRLRHELERATGLDDTPVRAEARCLDCGGTLERNYRPRTGTTDNGRGRNTWGLEDDWTCNHCRRTYTPTCYLLAVRARIEERANEEPA